MFRPPPGRAAANGDGEEAEPRQSLEILIVEFIRLCHTQFVHPNLGQLDGLEGNHLLKRRLLLRRRERLLRRMFRCHRWRSKSEEGRLEAV